MFTVQCVHTNKTQLNSIIHGEWERWNKKRARKKRRGKKERKKIKIRNQKIAANVRAISVYYYFCALCYWGGFNIISISHVIFFLFVSFFFWLLFRIYILCGYWLTCDGVITFFFLSFMLLLYRVWYAIGIVGGLFFFRLPISFIHSIWTAFFSCVIFTRVRVQRKEVSERMKKSNGQ